MLESKLTTSLIGIKSESFYPQCNCPHYCQNLYGVTVCANNCILCEHTFVGLVSQVLFAVEKFIYRLLGLKF